MTHKVLENFANNLLSILDEYSVIDYPIYIPSKGRPVKITSKTLEKSGISNYYVVVEPQDYYAYSSVYDSSNILILDQNDMGIQYVRNFCKTHSRSQGFDYHWQIDDNIRDFRIRKNNKNVRDNPLNLMSAAAEYVKEYDNIGILGFCHVGFAFAKTNAVDVNKQVYSCVLVNNKLDIEWRPNVVEDTDYSLQVLEESYCTLLLNTFLIGKDTTSVNSGGNDNSDQWRMIRANGLQKHWPGAFKITEQYGRIKVQPSKIWRRYTHMPKGKNEDLNSNNLDEFFA